MLNSVPSDSLNIHMSSEQKVSVSHFPFCEPFSLMYTESKCIYNFPTGPKSRYKSNRKWVVFHFACAMLCLWTTLSLFIDCNVPVFSLHAITYHLFLLPRWAMSMYEILITISLFVSACMSASQLIWWVHASLPSACILLFISINCKIYLYLWCIII